MFQLPLHMKLIPKPWQCQCLWILAVAGEFACATSYFDWEQLTEMKMKNHEQTYKILGYSILSLTHSLCAGH